MCLKFNFPSKSSLVVEEDEFLGRGSSGGIFPKIWKDMAKRGISEFLSISPVK